MTMTLQAIKYKRGRLEILDQLLLPDATRYLTIEGTEDGWKAIKKMQVRGAPAIAIVGCLSLAVELEGKSFDSVGDLEAFVGERLNFLVTARPTAVNMADSAARYVALARSLAAEGLKAGDISERLIEEFESMLEKDIATNKKIGQYGGDDILQRSKDSEVRILTHCNTGSLATAGYGTALGIVRYLHAGDKLDHVYCTETRPFNQGSRLTAYELVYEKMAATLVCESMALVGVGACVIRYLHAGDKLDHVYCTETRPYNQGSRLTAYELVYEKMAATLICDSMASILMQQKDISAVVVGADRVVANGDTANKIGTYQLAIVAKHHGVPFYVACPLTTYDGSKKTGKEIEIEERPATEMTSVKGVQVAAEGIQCWNPAFDVTPAELITGGIITEYGVFSPQKLSQGIAKYL